MKAICLARLSAAATLAWPLAAVAATPQQAGTASTATDPGQASQPGDPGDPGQTTEPRDTGDIVVLGRGETRQVQQLDQADLAILPPGTSPFKAIQKLPGVNFQSADAFGAYEWSERVSIRGFNQNQLGYTLDGIPLGDASYGNVNGLHISRAIISENIGRIQVSQGSGAIGTQATNNLGGTLEFFSSDPTPEFGVTLDGTGGSNNTVRAFFRLDTGTLGDGGPSAYVSYGYLDTDKWKGYGSQRQHQVNAKFVAPLLDPLRLVGTFDYSDRRENDYQDLSLDIIHRLGLNDDNISNDFPLAVRLADVGANTGYTGATKLNPAAGTIYPAPFANPDDAYFDAAGLRKDYLASLGVETASGAKIHGSLKGYYHDNHGRGLWFTPYVPSPTGVPISLRTTEYDIRRKGVFGSLGTRIGMFGDLTVGAWYEDNDFRQARRFYALGNRQYSTLNSLSFPVDPFATQWDFRYNTRTFQYYVEDKLELGRLIVDLGWKGYDVVDRARPIVAGGLASGRIQTRDWFQPHAGVTFSLAPGAELFAGFTEVKRAFVASATTGPFATTQAGFNALGQLKPEESDTYEGGARLKRGVLTASLAGYYIDFRNRLLAFANGAGIIGNPAILQNVGSVRSYGVEATAEVKLPAHFGGFASYAFNRSTYQDDVVDGTGKVLAATDGKTVVDSPRHIASAELTYDNSQLFGRFGASYMSKRYFTYLNDQSVPDRVLFDATLGVRVRLANARQIEVQVNGTNLLDARYIATVGSNGFGNSGDNQTLLAGAPRQVFATVKTRF